jgi:hypothetical protein
MSKISSFFIDPKIGPPLGPILNYFNLIYILKLYLFKIHFSIIITSWHRKVPALKPGGKLSCWSLARLILLPWRWRRHIPPKYLLTLNGLQSVIFQNIEFFLTITVKISNPLKCCLPLRCYYFCLSHLSNACYRPDWTKSPWFIYLFI